MQRRPAFPLSSRTGSLPCQEPQNQQPEWTLFHPPFQKYALYGRRIAQMFDHSIKESQRIAKFLFTHLASGGRIQRLVQLDKTFFDWAKNAAQGFGINGLLGVTVAK